MTQDLRELIERKRQDVANIQKGIALHKRALEDVAAAEGAAQERYNAVMSAIYADVTEAQNRRYEKPDASGLQMKLQPGEGERLPTAPILETSAYTGAHAAALKECEAAMKASARDFGHVGKRLAMLRNARDTLQAEIVGLEAQLEAAPEPEPVKRRGIFS